MRLALLLSLFAAPLFASDAPAAKKPKVKLAVLVVFDQFRGDYLDRWSQHFGPGGFRRLMTEGAHFPDCHYPYANTSTGPGHASILAGCSPEKHGIIGNSWYDAAAGAEVYCAGSSRYELVSRLTPRDLENLDPRSTPKPKRSAVGSPDRFLGPTLADVLKESTGGKGKVFGLSLKDRSAVMPAGRRPDGVYWFEGQFVTSTYYRDSLHPWVAAFNASGKAESYFGKDWVRCRSDLDYDAIVGPDDVRGENRSKTQGVAFPHPTTGGDAKPSTNYYEAMVASPYGNDLLLALAKECIQAERLGQDEVPDLLTISFSSNDLVGHSWGPDSQEVLDITLRSDAVMADLLTFLDRQVGKENYSVVVTADHGVCPIPEVAAARGNPQAKRISPVPLLIAAEKHLVEKFGAVGVPEPAVVPKTPGDQSPAPRGRWIEAASPPTFTLNRRQIAAMKLDAEVVRHELASFLAGQSGVDRVFTRGDLESNVPPADDKYWALVKRSFNADRSGDVTVVPLPYLYWDTRSSGTGHGTPHEYDTHAVFLAAGPGVGGGRRTEAVTPLHACAILADALGVSPPANAAYGLPTTLGAAPQNPPSR